MVKKDAPWLGPIGSKSFNEKCWKGFFSTRMHKNCKYILFYKFLISFEKCSAKRYLGKGERGIPRGFNSMDSPVGVNLIQLCYFILFRFFYQTVKLCSLIANKHTAILTLLSLQDRLESGNIFLFFKLLEKCWLQVLIYFLGGIHKVHMQ